MGNVAAFPDTAKFILQTNERSSQYPGITKDVAKLRGKEILKVRQDHPERFTDNVAATFPGLDQLSNQVKNGTIEWSGSDIQSRGKAMGVPLGEDRTDILLLMSLFNCF